MQHKERRTSKTKEFFKRFSKGSDISDKDKALQQQQQRRKSNVPPIDLNSIKHKAKAAGMSGSLDKVLEDIDETSLTPPSGAPLSSPETELSTLTDRGSSFSPSTYTASSGGGTGSADRKSRLYPCSLLEFSEDNHNVIVIGPNAFNDNNAEVIRHPVGTIAAEEEEKRKKKGKSRSKKKLTSPKTSPVSLSAALRYTPMTLSLKPEKPVPSIENTKEKVKEINARLKRGPSGADKQGFLYMYKIDGDANPLYRKIGCTSRLPDRRLKEWPHSVKVKSWPVKRHKFAEILSFWLLHRVRVHRYVMNKTADDKLVLISVNAHTKLQIQDVTWSSYKSVGEPIVFAGKTRHIEWFLCDEKTLIYVIEAVVKDVNFHWADEPWDKMFEGMNKK